jgi:glycosyltransferase involved in cell wall biosynthesis
VATAAGAEVAGHVPSMAEEFRRASVLVVPLWVGAGARVKIVEAMAAGLPVAATPFAAEGLGLTPGLEYAAAASPAALGEAVSALLSSPARRAEIYRAARAAAAERFSLEAVAAAQNELCRSVAR